MDQNRLNEEKSPYLLQHADNPVNWFPWCEKAFERAKKEDKPVFVSIGYATCHWCHVMAHESFEDPEVAELLNDAFVNIKVDREERPDIDNTYMTVCQMLTGSGGWPLSIFMTPEKKPFYAATYIPKTGRYGRPGMKELIPRLKELWEENRDKIHGSADEISKAFRKSGQLEPGSNPDESFLEKAFKQFRSQYDSERGGFGNAPKFPSPHNHGFLLRYWKRTGAQDALDMVVESLVNMRRGGIYDHIGFGFHRYSTDAEWLLPHFEKMLYDQALLMMAYTEGWQITGRPILKQTAEEIAAYLFRDMRSGNGGFYSAEDADSEGEEGKFYVWTLDEISETLSTDESELFTDLYNIREEGNYKEESTGRKTGKNIPHLRESIETWADKKEASPDELKEQLESIRRKLYEHREQRPRPLLDDKILTDWNGLIIAALAKAGRILNKPLFVKRARESADFILNRMLDDDRLMHRYRDGEVAIEGKADDYAFLIWGLLELYEADLDSSYLQMAVKLNEWMLGRFWDSQEGGFYFTGEDSEELLGRKKEGFDSAMPSGNSVAMLNLLRLGRITANPELEEKAEQIGRLFSDQISQAPTGFGQMLQGVDFALGPSVELVIAGEKSSDETQKMLREVNNNFIPKKITVLNDPEDGEIRRLAPYTKEQTMNEGKSTAYLCRDYSCEQPVTNPDDLSRMLGEL